jgi:hypothetical protein
LKREEYHSVRYIDKTKKRIDCMEKEMVRDIQEDIAKVKKIEKAKKRKKIIFGTGVGIVIVALLVGAFFVGRLTSQDSGDAIADNDGNSEVDGDNDNGISENCADDEPTDQGSTPEKSLEEQLLGTMIEVGYTAEGIGIDEVGSIENSPIAPFQTVSALIGFRADGAIAGGAGALFWRNGTNGEWRFFGGAQQILTCDKFVNFMRPFAGISCYDNVNVGEGGDHITTVGDFFDLF